MQPSDYKQNKKFYAITYNRSTPTITKWMSQDLPLDDVEAMKPHLALKASFGQPTAEAVPLFDKPAPSVDPASQKGGEIQKPPASGKPEDDQRPEWMIKRERAAVDLAAAKLKLSIAEKEHIKRDAVREAGIRIGNELEAELRAIESDLPSSCAGMDSAELKEKIEDYFVTLRKNLKKNLNHAERAGNTESSS